MGETKASDISTRNCAQELFRNSVSDPRTKPRRSRIRKLGTHTGVRVRWLGRINRFAHPQKLNVRRNASPSRAVRCLNVHYYCDSSLRASQKNFEMQADAFVLH